MKKVVCVGTLDANHEIKSRQKNDAARRCYMNNNRDQSDDILTMFVMEMVFVLLLFCGYIAPIGS
jgi:hypothetical protein